MELFVFISWKDITHPGAGGAELVHHELSKRLVRDGFQVCHLVPGYRGCESRSRVDGVEIRRFGQSIFSFYSASIHFLFQLRSRTSVLVDVFNCVGSFANLVFPSRKSMLVIHHIQGPTWFLQPPIGQAPKPLIFLMTHLGFLIEKFQLRLQALLGRGPVVTVSQSTARELAGCGFAPERIHIMPCACAMEPLGDPAESLPKESEFTVLLLGPRRVKRPMETLRGFELFHRRHPEARLWVVGWGTEEPDLRRAAEERGIEVTFWGRVSEEVKRELLQRAHVVCKSSIKEGWGIVVIEANAMATPVIGADVPGLRDALAFDNGFLYTSGAEGLAETIDHVYEMWSERPREYSDLRARALAAAHIFDFDRSYRAFRTILDQSSDDEEISVHPAG